MNNRKPPEHTFELYTDTVYSAELPGTWEALHKRPATVVTAQASWRDNTSARVRKSLENMFPHDFQMIEGVAVSKYSSPSSNGIVYKVNGESSQLTLAAAVVRMCELLAIGGRNG